MVQLRLQLCLMKKASRNHRLKGSAIAIKIKTLFKTKVMSRWVLKVSTSRHLNMVHFPRQSNRPEKVVPILVRVRMKVWKSRLLRLRKEENLILRLLCLIALPRRSRIMTMLPTLVLEVVAVGEVARRPLEMYQLRTGLTPRRSHLWRMRKCALPNLASGAC